MNKSEDGSGHGQDTSAEYEITDGHFVSLTGNPIKGKNIEEDPARRWRDDLDDYRKDTIWQRIAQDRQIWKQHAEAFPQPRDTMIA